jgi:hypothetical protein
MAASASYQTPLKLLRYISQEDISALELRDGIADRIVSITDYFTTAPGIALMTAINRIAGYELITKHASIGATLISVYFPMDCTEHNDDITTDDYLRSSSFIGSRGGIYKPRKIEVQLREERGPSILTNRHQTHNIHGFLLYNTRKPADLYFRSFGVAPSRTVNGVLKPGLAKPVFITELNYIEDPVTFKSKTQSRLIRIPGAISPFSDEPIFVDCDQSGTNSTHNHLGNLTSLGRPAVCRAFEGCRPNAIVGARLGRLMEGFETWEEINFRGTGRIAGWVIANHFRVETHERFIGESKASEKRHRAIVHSEIKNPIHIAPLMQYALTSLLNDDDLFPSLRRGPLSPS